MIRDQGGYSTSIGQAQYRPRHHEPRGVARTPTGPDCRLGRKVAIGLELRWKESPRLERTRVRVRQSAQLGRREYFISLYDWPSGWAKPHYLSCLIRHLPLLVSRQRAPLVSARSRPAQRHKLAVKVPSSQRDVRLSRPRLGARFAGSMSTLVSGAVKLEMDD